MPRNLPFQMPQLALEVAKPRDRLQIQPGARRGGAHLAERRGGLRFQLAAELGHKHDVRAGASGQLERRQRRARKP